MKGAKAGPTWVGRAHGAHAPEGAGKIMAPDHPLYHPAVARVAEAAKDAKGARDKSFAARMNKLLAETDPKKREQLEREMRKDDEEAERAQREAREQDVEHRERAKAASDKIDALKNPPKQNPKKKK